MQDLRPLAGHLAHAWSVTICIRPFGTASCGLSTIASLHLLANHQSPNTASWLICCWGRFINVQQPYCRLLAPGHRLLHALRVKQSPGLLLAPGMTASNGGWQAMPLAAPDVA